LGALHCRVKPVEVSSNAVLAPNVLRKWVLSGFCTAGSPHGLRNRAHETAGWRRGDADRRAALFRESLSSKTERWGLGLTWALSPKRIRGVPNLLRLCFDELLTPTYYDMGSARFHDASNSTTWRRLCTARTKRAVGRSRRMRLPSLIGSQVMAQCRALSRTGPSNGIAEIHLPMRERLGSSGLASSGGAASGIDSGGTG